MNALSPEFLVAQLGELVRRPLWVAYSGGRDSHVLLHLAVRAGLDVRAVHVDHGLHAASDDWSRHCGEVCRELGVAVTQRRVDVENTAEGGLEAAAREARYGVFETLLEPGQVLLTAQHREDQAETVLLRLLRGAGARGLAAMPRRRKLGRGLLLRPLLDVDREAINRYAAAQGLQWVDDPSNADTLADRNYLRHRALPVLRERWPDVDARLARTAERAAEDAALIRDLAELDLAACSDGANLRVDALRGLSARRRRNAVRRWMHGHGCRPPGARRLTDGLDALLDAGADREPVLRWRDGVVRRYRQRLHLLRREPGPPPETPLQWDLHGVLLIPGMGRLTTSRSGAGVRLRAELAGRSDVRVRFRRGGERIRPAGAPHHRALKTLFQEAGIPPWERRRVPLVYIGGELACVGERWVAEGFAAPGDDPGLRLRWVPEPAGFAGWEEE